MRIEQLEYIAAVTQHGSLRRASEQLHLSQPALSEAVTKLERELGVTLLDRRRTGARISRQGQDLLPHMVGVLEAVDRLRAAAGDQSVLTRPLRVGTVNAAHSTLLVPAVRELRESHPRTPVEVISTRQAEITQGLAEGAFDAGLVNILPGDELPEDLHTQLLVHGRPVVCLRTDNPLAQQEAISVAELREQPFVAMRAGYLMNRFTHRLFDGSLPVTSYSTDGAEMGKAMVAEGLGLTVLPDYSVEGDPLVQAGLLTHRPIAGDSTRVTLLMLRRDVRHVPPLLRELEAALVAQARTRTASARARAAGDPPPPGPGRPVAADRRVVDIAG